MKSSKYNLLIVTLGALSAIGPFAIDTYLPAFPAIAKSFGADMAQVGYTLTSYFIGISLGQLVYGPMLDRFGRRLPLMAGLVAFALAAVASACAASIEWLIVSRFFMALGGCVGMVGGRAVVRDVFPPHEAAAIFSTLMLFIGVAPIVAPTVGGLIVGYWGWRWIFVFMAVVAVLVLLAFSLFIPESKGPDPSVSLRPRHVMREYWIVLKEPMFVTYSIASGAASAAMFAYISGGPFVFMKLLDFSEREFGVMFGFNAMGLIVGSQVNRLLLKKYSSEAISLATAGMQVVAGMALLGEVALGDMNPASMILSIFMFQLFGGMQFPNNTALALQPFTRGLGSASALLGGVQVISSAVSSGLVSVMNDGTAFPMAGAMAFWAFVSFVLLAARRPARLKSAQTA
ncbi:MAG: multidrug effflux MFS transporter [Syntrophobacteraceae bacterium]